MKGLRVIHGFLNSNECKLLMALVDKSFARLAPFYTQGHFDKVMVGDFREMMVSAWNSDSLPQQIFNRLKTEARISDNLKWESIHVLDLRDQNVGIHCILLKSGINHHIDHDCTGNVILGLNLLSDTVIKFKKDNVEKEILLLPNSAYIMMDEARYEWSHSIPAGKDHTFCGKEIIRFRRVSLLLRNGKN
jgi:hypothetical protein